MVLILRFELRCLRGQILSLLCLPFHHSGMEGFVCAADKNATHYIILDFPYKEKIEDEYWISPEKYNVYFDIKATMV